MLEHVSRLHPLISDNIHAKISCAVYVKPEKSKKASLFLRLGLPSTLIRNEGGVFERFFKREKFDNAGCQLCVLVWTENIFLRRISFFIKKPSENDGVP